MLRSVEVRLYRYISRTLSDPEAAKDVLQETFVRMYRGLRWLDDPGLFVAWSYRIATREAFRSLRRSRRWREGATDLDAIDALATADDRMAGRWQPDMEDLLSRLSPASRAVLALRYLHDMPLDDIAAVLGIPLGTVKSRLAYGLRRLREEMSK